MEDNYSDFRMDSNKLEAVKLFLKEGKSYSEIGRLLDLDSRTVKRIYTRMIELEEIEEQEEKKEEISYVPLGEYQNLLKRVQELERWRNNEYVNEYNALRDYVAKTVVPHVDFLRDSNRSLSGRIGTNTINIEHLQYDVNLIKEIKKVEIAEFMAKVEKRRNERDRAEEESNKRIVENMAEERRQRERGSTDASFKKLEELKNMDKKRY